MEAHKCYARILLYDGFTPEKVIYLRTGLNVESLVKWKWYFEYLQALVKVHHPKRKVELTTGVATVLLGDEWKQYKTATLLKHRKSKLKQLESTEVERDLFGFAEEANNENIAKVKNEIEQLENGTYPIAEFPEYINEIKQWI